LGETPSDLGSWGGASSDLEEESTQRPRDRARGGELAASRRLPVPPLVFGGAEIAERGVPTVWVVPGLEVLSTAAKRGILAV